MIFKLRNQKGFALLETTLALTVLFAGIVSGFWLVTNKVKDARAVALADQMQTLNGAVATYQTKNFSGLVAAVPVVAGFANALRPTPAELRTAGYLNAGFSDTTAYGSNYEIFISKIPAGCVAPNCDLNSLVTIDTPVLLTGSATPDSRSLGVCAERIGGNAGVSLTAPTFEGAEGAWTMANPLNLAGLVAVQGGYGSSGFTEFYRRDGTLPLTADLAGGGFNVGNVNNVTAAGTVSGTDVTAANNVTATNNVTGTNVTASSTVTGVTGTYSGQVTANRHVATTDIRAPIFYDTNAAFYVDPGGTSNIFRMTAVADMRAPLFYDSNNTGYYVDPNGTSRMSYLNFDSGQINTVVTENTACAPNGRIARDAVGLILSCQSGLWKKASGSADGLGIGQTWRNMTGSAVGCAGVRGNGVTCTNTTGEPIQVAVSVQYTGGAPVVSFTVGGVQVSRLTLGFGGVQSYFVVPPGNTYVASIPAGAQLLNWAELRP